MRRVEEEMRKRERLEAERKERERQLSEQQAEAERKAIEECERYVDIDYHYTPSIFRFLFLIFNSYSFSHRIFLHTIYIHYITYNVWVDSYE